MTVAARLLAISVAWIAIQIGSGYLTHRMPARWFRRDGWLFRSRGFERGGRFYRRVFRVHRWKDRLPEAGALFAGGFSKRRLASGSPADSLGVLERFVVETRRAELTHWLPVFFSLSFFLWNPPDVAAWMPPIGLLGNLPFIIVQRSNRPRLLTLQKRSGGTMSHNENRVQPSAANPRYWQYRGTPVMLIGGSVEDNLYQLVIDEGLGMPDLAEHLDLLRSCGGNYVRCTMSCRDEGNLWPYAKRDGVYDLDEWNEEFWQRFETFLELTHEREIFPQVELWAYHDFYGTYGRWDLNPYNPACNSNYSASETTLKEHAVGANDEERHPFFWTVPKLNDDTVVLGYQRRFVDRLLDHSLRYDHVLYCMTNEIHPGDSAEWGWYWADYIRSYADERGKRIETTEMYWNPNMQDPVHRNSIDHPEIYTFFECAQSSGVDGEKNWDNFVYVRDELSPHPRPVNNVKVYGADGGPSFGPTTQVGTERFWRALIGGSAAVRFHRPPAGLGLSKTAQAHITSARMLADAIPFTECSPRNDLLADRDEDAAYCLAKPDSSYSVYFPRAGSVTLQLATSESAPVRPLRVRWLDIASSTWADGDEVGGGRVRLETPGDGQFVALVS